MSGFPRSHSRILTLPRQNSHIYIEGLPHFYGRVPTLPQQDSHTPTARFPHSHGRIPTLPLQESHTPTAGFPHSLSTSRVPNFHLGWPDLRILLKLPQNKRATQLYVDFLLCVCDPARLYECYTHKYLTRDRQI